MFISSNPSASDVVDKVYVREVLETPELKVYTWSSRAQYNVVGAEYIITEKLSGIQLSAVWKGMEI